MRMIRLQAYTHTAWWLRYYILGCSWACAITNRAPDPEKLNFWINRAIKIKFREVNCE